MKPRCGCSTYDLLTPAWLFYFIQLLLVRICKPKIVINCLSSWFERIFIEHYPAKINSHTGTLLFELASFSCLQLDWPLRRVDCINLSPACHMEMETGIPSSALPKDSSELSGLFSILSFSCSAPNREVIIISSTLFCCCCSCCYPTPSEGWGHGGRPRIPRIRATPKGLDQRS